VRRAESTSGRPRHGTPRLIPALAVAVALHAWPAPARAQDVPVSLTLRQALEIAARESPRVQIARLQAAEAVSGIDVARSALRPQIDFRVGDSYQTANLAAALGIDIPGLPNRVGPFQQFDARPVITENLDVASFRGVRAATERAAGQRWLEQSARESVALAVVDTYLQAVEIDARLESAQARLDTANALLVQVRQFNAAGTASRLDESRALSRAELEQSSIAQLRAERVIKQMTLMNLLGQSPGTQVTLVDRLTPPDPGPDPGPVAVAVRLESPGGTTPEVRAAEAQMRAAVAEKEQAVAARYPAVTLTGDFGLFGRSIGNNLSTYAVRAMVAVPLSTGGRTDAAIGAAALRVREAEQEVRQARLQRETDILTAQVALDAALRAHARASEAVTAAHTSIRLAQARFGGGLSTNLDVLAAQETVADVEAAEIQYRYNFYVARARLARAKGDIMAVFDR
jgi:outer membrane protein TolC